MAQDQTDASDGEPRDLERDNQRLRSMLGRAHDALLAAAPPSPALKLVPRKGLLGGARRTVVVGNSPDVLKAEAGATIDACDIVVRINNFETAGFEAHVGRKTTFAVVSPAALPSAGLKAVPAARVFVFGADLKANFSAIREKMTGPEGCGVRPVEENILSPLLYNDRIQALCEYPLIRYRWPSTGVAAIVWAMDVFAALGPVFIHGFSFYSEPDAALNHRYFGAPTEKMRYHDFAAEKRLCERLIAEGRIAPLA